MNATPLPSSRHPRAFTLLELMIVIALIAVLVLISWSSYGYYIRKADSVACTKKMRGWGVALATYVSDKQTWPQEDVLNDASGNPPSEKVLWNWWYNEMKPYGVDRDAWYCPADLRKKRGSKQSEQEDDDGIKGEIEDHSYITAKFSFGSYKPFEYGQPWMTESQDFHESGMNVLMPDGTIQKQFSLDAVRKMKMGSGK
jgi:prepilin-type N-terminal cleavage/methylation domain-containing protein